MEKNLKAWQRSLIRNSMDEYRQAQENYFLKGKPFVELEDGAKAFSLVTPPLGSPAAKRRVRSIIKTMSSPSGESPLTKGQLPSEGRTPHVITIAVSYDCQCDCLHCSASRFRDEVSRNGNALSSEELITAVCESVDLGTTCVILTGGEPLMFDGIYDVISAVDRSRSICTIFTNGEFLNESTVKKLKQAGVYGVFVSLDHSDPHRHDENRQRPGLFERAANGLKLCQEASILTGISTFATREKIQDGELDAMMDRAKELNVLEVFLFDVIPTGRLINQHECILTDDEVEQIGNFRSKYTEKNDYPRIIHQTMFASIAYPCVAEGCPAGMVQMHLRANGDVSPCDFTPYSFGNIRKNSLTEIWKIMSESSLYAKSSKRCRLANPEYWKSLEQHALTDSASQ